jgi:hypothetical protein
MKRIARTLQPLALLFTITAIGLVGCGDEPLKPVGGFPPPGITPAHFAIENRKDTLAGKSLICTGRVRNISAESWLLLSVHFEAVFDRGDNVGVHTEADAVVNAMVAPGGAVPYSMTIPTNGLPLINLFISARQGP